MFGEIILVGGVTIICAGVEYCLETMGKERESHIVGVITKAGLGVYAIKQLNQVFRELTNSFL